MQSLLNDLHHGSYKFWAATAFVVFKNALYK